MSEMTPPFDGEVCRRTSVDKSSWQPGPWNSEPDFIEWLDPGTGLTCQINRNVGGALCGYVGLPSHHPDWGAHDANREGSRLDCHGGITYGQEDVERRLWFVGFDCAHVFDLSPAYEATLRHIHADRGAEGRDQYKNIEYVKAQVESLAQQLFEPLSALASTLEDTWAPRS